eukprot:TRINITY_DN827_c1_g3_i1.p1 TRINITY_DN827_c1_g3~~TRINITY_DN827_c1_g3_i1.p1  ORF type:complete len:169 (+),score=50.32 TRINITY_DN827_c1_g3_i1:135-641(+)
MMMPRLSGAKRSSSSDDPESKRSRTTPRWFPRILNPSSSITTTTITSSSGDSTTTTSTTTTSSVVPSTTDVEITRGQGMFLSGLGNYNRRNGMRASSALSEKGSLEGEHEESAADQSIGDMSTHYHQCIQQHLHEMKTRSEARTLRQKHQAGNGSIPVDCIDDIEDDD